MPYQESRCHPESTRPSDGVPEPTDPDRGETIGVQDPHLKWEPLLAGTLLERTGTRIVSLSPATGEMTMPVAGNTQPAGLLHGGATIALAESVASMCAYLHAREVHGPDAQAVGTSVSALHHRSARSGIVHARCRALRLGRTIANYEVDVRDEEERLISTVSIATMLLPPR